MSPSPSHYPTWRLLLGGLTVWCIAVTVGAGFYLLSLSHANREHEQSQQHTNQQFAKALVVTDRKFHEALRITTAQSAYSINKSVCGFRSLVEGARKSAIQTRAKYAAFTPVERQKNEQTIKRLNRFLDTQVTVPVTFDCSKLPKHAPEGTTP